MKQNWTYKKLGEVCTIERGGSPRPINDYITDAPNGLNWIKIGDAVEGSKYISSTKEKIKPEGLKKTRLVHKGDFILSNSMSFGKPYILEIDGCIHDGWLVIHDNNGTFDKSFLYYLLRSPNMYMEFQRLAVGGVVNNLNSEIVRNVVVPVPPLAIQSRIVSELDLLQSLIDKQKAQLKEYDTLAQSIFYDMFGDPVENEKGWEVKKLGDCCNSELGKTLNQSKDTGTLRPYLCAINIQWNKIIKENLKQTQFEDTELERYSVKKGDLLICEGGDIGRAAIWNEDEEIQYQNALHRLRFGKEMIPIFCLYHMKYLKDKGVLDNRYGKGVTIKHLVKSALLSIPFILPPLSLQQSFASKTEAIERQKELINQSIREAQTLFDSRMEYYFGE